MSKTLPLVKIPPNALIHRLGSSTPTPSNALLRFSEKGWTINKSKKEGWAIVGDVEGRKLAVETLLSRHRIHPNPPSPGPFPYLSTLQSPSSFSSSSSKNRVEDRLSTYKPIRHLAFARPTSTGEFTDFTARYGALQEEDKISFRDYLLSLDPQPDPGEIERVCGLMKINHLLDLPFISLSSGQNRRSRIATALLTRPVLLILEDPMSGLDIQSRSQVSTILGELNDLEEEGIKIVLVLRGKKGNVDIPDWITNIAQISNGHVSISTKEEYEQSHVQNESEDNSIETARIQEISEETQNDSRKELVKLDKISISYGEGTRPVLKQVSWTIKEGEKWHLQGANGSGKTTLLSLILGHHPKSFSLPSSTLELFNKPRREIATSTLKKMVGHTSPEIYASFPRSMGLTAYSTIGTGFEGVFSRRNLDEEQKGRVLGLLDQVRDLLQPSSRRQDGSRERGGKAADLDLDLKTIALKQFSHFTPSQQGLLLFLRSIVNRPNLLILDEPSQGIDENIWERCKIILENEWKQNPEMSTIVVSHYEDEVPWKKGQGKILRLDQGIASIE